MMINFEELYQKHYPSVYRACLARFKDAGFAAEITQEAFVRALANQETLRDAEKFKSWVTAIALRYGSLKAREDQMRFNALPPVEMMESGWETAAADDLHIDDVNFIRRWILSLKEPDQQLFLMKYYYVMTSKEISVETGKPEGTVKSRLAYLKGKLKAALQHESA